jgi:hypothetical protein
MATTTARSEGARSARGGRQRAKSTGEGNGGRTAAALSEAARKAWETRRARGWQHPRKVRPLTAKEIAVAAGVPLAKVRRVLELAAKRVPASTPAGKGR